MYVTYGTCKILIGLQYTSYIRIQTDNDNKELDESGADAIYSADDTEASVEITLPDGSKLKMEHPFELIKQEKWEKKDRKSDLQNALNAEGSSLRSLFLFLYFV